MTTVHDAAYEVLRSFGMTTIFGNPGSNELTFLDDFPDGLPLRPDPAGRCRRGDGRRLLAVDRRPGPGQPPRRRRSRPGDGCAGQLAALRHAAGHPQRPAGTVPGHPRGAADERRRDQLAETAGQGQLRSAVGGDGPRHPRPRRPPRDERADRARFRLGPARRLARRGRRRRRGPSAAQLASRPAPTTEAIDELCRAPRPGREAAAHLRRRRRPLRRLGRRRATRRATAGPGAAGDRGRADLVPDGPPLLSAGRSA